MVCYIDVMSAPTQKETTSGNMSLAGKPFSEMASALSEQLISSFKVLNHEYRPVNQDRCGDDMEKLQNQEERGEKLVVIHALQEAVKQATSEEQNLLSYYLCITAMCLMADTPNYHSF